MRRIALLYILVILAVTSVSAEHKFKKKEIIEFPPIKVDSILTYFWNNEINDWDLGGSWVNPNTSIIIDSAGLHAETIIINRETGEYISREKFSRYSDNRIITHIYQEWVNEAWQNTRRDSYKYNSAGHIIEFKIERWRANQWVNDVRFTHYMYTEFMQIMYYEEEQWMNEQWTPSANESRYYNSGQELIERINSFADGTYRYRFFFTYDHFKNSSEWVYSTYTAESSTWITRQKLITRLDNCDNVQSQTRQHNYDGIWVNYSKMEYFRSLNLNPEEQGNTRIAICHNGHTLYLPLKAVQNHILRHGDCYGSCSEISMEDEKNCKRIGNNPSNHKPNANGNSRMKSMASEEIYPDKDITREFRIYPNPFQTNLIIELEEHNPFESVKIIDMQGRLLKTYEIAGLKRLTISRDGLEKGMYFLILQGSESKSFRIIAQ